jgi:putative ABC transport system permease protein
MKPPFPQQNEGFASQQSRLSQWYCRWLIVVHNLANFGLRQTLTLITMAIGALGLSATLFIGKGALDGLWVDLDNLMGNRVTVFPDAGPNDILLSRRPEPSITPGDLRFLRQHVKNAKYIEPSIVGRESVAFQDKKMVMSIDGLTPILLQETMYTPLSGKGFSLAAESGFSQECMLTFSGAKKLGFILQPDQKQTLRFGIHRCSVVAIVPDAPESDERFKSRLIIPHLWARQLWGKVNDVGQILVAWKSPQMMEQTIVQLRSALNQIRAPDAYYLSSSQFAIKKRKNIVSNIMAVGILQALFSVLVASIGIVNVMLANIVQRSREFAIRMAMGADSNDIAIIVVLESTMFGFLGAVVGIALAILVSPFVTSLIADSVPEASRLQPMFSIQGMLIPLLVCGLSGLAAGIVPALRARKVDVLAVLRAE